MDYEAILAEKDATIADLQSSVSQLQFELAQLKKMIFGSKRERFITEVDAQQLSLFGSETSDNTQEIVVEKQHIEFDRKAPRKHEGRNPLPDHLPVNEIVIEPEDGIEGMTRIGEEITETLEYIPGSLVRKRIVRPKYVRTDLGTIHIAQLPSRPLPKCIAEASLLAYIMVCKFIDHMPFYRQIQRFIREYKWEVTDSTINEWFVACCTLMHPLYEKLIDKVLHSDYLQVDESPIKVLDQDNPKGIHKGYQWVYYSQENKLVLFSYRKGRGENGPKEMLSAYQGILQCDGYKVYDKIGSKPGIQLAGCMAHVRRKYVDAVKNDKARSEFALGIMQQIYALERLSKEMNAEDRRNYRKEHTSILFKELREWVEKEYPKVQPKSKIGGAMKYTLKQWHKLEPILDDGRIEIDNNLIENKIRPLALGRKNYLFAGSHAGAERIAMMYSFFGSCKAHDINPYEWLKTTLEKISDTKLSDLESLLPGAGV